MNGSGASAQVTSTSAGSRNTFWAFSDAVLEWPVGAGDIIPGRHECDFFRRALDLVDRRAPSLGLRFVVTEETGRRMPVRGDDVVVICLGDELARMPAYAHDVRLVAKTYGTSRRSRADASSLGSGSAAPVRQWLVQLRRAPSFAAGHLRSLIRGRPAIVDLPLGTFLLRGVPFVPFADRSFDAWFSGSVYSGANERDGMLGIFRSQKTRARKSFLDALIAFERARPNLKVHGGVIRSFHDAAGHSDPYSTSLMESRIALCPRGNSLETYRLGEAMSFGCVCIVEALPSRDFYDGAPLVRVERWDELTATVDRLLSDPAGLERMHEETLTWWRAHLSEDAVATRILNALGRD